MFCYASLLARFFVCSVLLSSFFFLPSPLSLLDEEAGARRQFPSFFSFCAPFAVPKEENKQNMDYCLNRALCVFVACAACTCRYCCSMYIRPFSFLLLLILLLLLLYHKPNHPFTSTSCSHSQTPS